VYENASQSDNASLVDRLVAVLRARPSGLFTDIDGTISVIAARPEAACVLPQARRALVGLRDVLDVVGVVTGRSVGDAYRMVGIDGLAYIGNHGMEVWRDGAAELVPEVRPWAPRLAEVLAVVREQLAAEPRATQDGVLIEDKRASASIHYRLTVDPVRTRLRLLQLLERAAGTSGLRIEEGRMVINLLPPLAITKGSAVTWLARDRVLRGLVYLGDDNTDAHAFAALRVLSESARVRTLAIGVVGHETPTSVRELADASLPSATAVAELLLRVLDRLKTGATMEPGVPISGSG
jgi:trehalose 6-phosphate phosphatase